MRQAPSWDEYYMGIAEAVKLKSKDPSTQVGCVLVNPYYQSIGTGYNGFAPGAEETPELWERPAKYDRVIHAEMNAIGQAAQNGHPTRSATVYCTHFPCLACAKVLIAAGIKKVIYGQPVKGWDDDHKKAADRFQDAGVDLIWL